MSGSLEELKLQRDQIRQHLEWLEAQIAEAERTHPAVEPAIVSDPATTSSDEPVASKSAASAEATPEAHPLEFQAAHYQAKTQDQIQRAKLGCLSLFALATFLFLFLIFGLPYFF